MDPRPPETLAIDGLVVRRHRPDDATALAAAAALSLEHLAPWMPWATEEGVTTEAMARFIDESTQRAADGTEAVYGLFDPVDGSCLGGCGLHDRIGRGGVEIGYWLRVDATGRGLMTHVARSLTDLALTLDGVDRVEIHCDEANRASAAVPRRLGYRLARVDSVPVAAPAETGRQMIWVWPTEP